MDETRLSMEQAVVESFLGQIVMVVEDEQVCSLKFGRSAEASTGWSLVRGEPHSPVLVAAIEQGKGREETGAILDFLQFYAEWHFSREERCMAERQCPIAETNHRAHGAFLRTFKRLYDLYYQSNVDPRLISETLKELEMWIINHIIKIDTQLRFCP